MLARSFCTIASNMYKNPIKMGFKSLQLTNFVPPHCCVPPATKPPAAMAIVCVCLDWVKAVETRTTPAPNSSCRAIRALAIYATNSFNHLPLARKVCWPTGVRFMVSFSVTLLFGPGLFWCASEHAETYTSVHVFMYFYAAPCNFSSRDRLHCSSCCTV